MKLLILVQSCQKNRPTRQRAIQKTWAQDVPEGGSLYFVEGGHSNKKIEGARLLLDCPDTYNGLPQKTYEMFRFSRDSLDFDGILKCDDDAYVHPGRLYRYDFSNKHYVGTPTNRRGSKGGAYRIAQGGSYYVSRFAIETILSTPFWDCTNRPWWRNDIVHENSLSGGGEDCMVYDLLKVGGILLHEVNKFNAAEYPSPYEDLGIISCHHVSPAKMYAIHRQKKRPLPLNMLFLLGTRLFKKIRRPLDKRRGC